MAGMDSTRGCIERKTQGQGFHQVLETNIFVKFFNSIPFYFL